MDKKSIIDTISPKVDELNCFIVEVEISKDNDVFVCIESKNSTVRIEDCELINDLILSKFDQEQEDYSLTISSAGLDQAFKVLEQYKKAVGSEVEALVKGGKKIVGVLENANEDGVFLRYSAKESVEGKKKKVLVEHLDFFPYNELNSLMYHIDFK